MRVVSSKVMRIDLANRGMSVVDCRLSITLIIDPKAFERRRLIEHRHRLLDDYMSLPVYTFFYTSNYEYTALK